MKLITAIIKPHMLDDVRDGLSRARGPGHDCHRGEGLRSSERAHRDLPGRRVFRGFRSEVKIEIVVADERVDTIVEAIKSSARTGAIGDGKVFVSDVGQAVRIRTGEVGGDAL